MLLSILTTKMVCFETMHPISLPSFLYTRFAGVAIVKTPVTCLNLFFIGTVDGNNLSSYMSLKSHNLTNLFQGWHALWDFSYQIWGTLSVLWCSYFYKSDMLVRLTRLFVGLFHGVADLQDFSDL